ncbi:hypothetical protein Q9L58_008231 [Maublancomyces gigas]|uniref:Uncharacterized protein n=1 Tax=Discina gigas TaxID=1032678 RepID=A0ABR3GA78_9PEZI
MSLQPGQNNLPPRNSTSASGGISSDVSSAILRPVLMQVPPPDKTGLQARKRFVDGGGAEDGNGTIYRSVAYRTEGARLACLVNASVTVCGDDAIYAFGGFDQYTDEVVGSCGDVLGTTNFLLNSVQPRVETGPAYIHVDAGR